MPEWFNYDNEKLLELYADALSGARTGLTIDEVNLIRKAILTRMEANKNAEIQ